MVGRGDGRTEVAVEWGGTSRWRGSSGMGRY